MSVLDDLKMIHSRDAQDALGVAQKQYLQLQHDFEEVDTSSLNFSSVDNIVVAGMGGSALAASLFLSWPGVSKPLEVWRSYGLPNYAGAKTLFVASSYSGNTEESLDALHEAQFRGCQIVVMAAGGTLESIATENNYPFFNIPVGLQPRMAVCYNFAALVQLFDGSGVIFEGAQRELRDTAEWLGEQGKAFLPDVQTSENPAKQLALELIGSSIVVYAGPKLFPAAYKWKINFNENAKTISWCNQLPEFNHNEFLGWTSHPVDKPYKVVDLRGSIEHPQVQRRFDISAKLLSGKRPAPEVVQAEGDSHLKQLLWTVQFGDFVSLYVALLNGLDPTPVAIIEKLKAELK
ncbi:bifunctional phosphoglucose/phosphomannose isomerase [soil metagenome]